MSDTSSILVPGVRELGREVLKSLIHHEDRGKTKLSLLLRPSSIADSKKTAEIEAHKGMGVDIVSGDGVKDSKEQLSTTFTSYNTVISCTGMTFPKGTQLKIAQDLFDEQLDVRELLRSQQETKWVIVSTGMFVSFRFEPAFGVVDLKQASMAAFGSWENAITVTSPEDIGTLTAEIVLAAPEEHGVVYVGGDTVSVSELADIVERLLCRKVTRRLKTISQLNSELAEEPNDVMRKYRAVFGAGVGVSWEKAQSSNAQRGIRTISVEQWAREHLKQNN